MYSMNGDFFNIMYFTTKEWRYLGEMNYITVPNILYNSAKLLGLSTFLRVPNLHTIYIPAPCWLHHLGASSSVGHWNWGKADHCRPSHPHIKLLKQFSLHVVFTHRHTISCIYHIITYCIYMFCVVEQSQSCKVLVTYCVVCIYILCPWVCSVALVNGLESTHWLAHWGIPAHVFWQHSLMANRAGPQLSNDHSALTHLYLFYRTEA